MGNIQEEDHKILTMQDLAEAANKSLPQVIRRM